MLSASLYAQVAKIRFLDGTAGYAVGPKLVFNRVGDTLTLESFDQKVWRTIETPDPSLVSKQGVIQKIISSNQDIYARVKFTSSDDTDLVEDFSVALFNVGDTVQITKRKDSEGLDIYRMYFGQLPGKAAEEYQLAVLKKIFR